MWGLQRKQSFLPAFMNAVNRLINPGAGIRPQTGGILKMERKIFPLGAGAKKRWTKKMHGKYLLVTQLDN